MKKAVLLAINLTIVILLAATFSIAAEGKTAAGKSAGGAEVTPVKAAEATPSKSAENIPAKALQTAPVKVSEAELLDLNSASSAQLQKGLGIGEATAQKIIAGRPYFKKDQLKSRKILTAAQYYKIKDKIIAKRPKASAKCYVPR